MNAKDTLAILDKHGVLAGDARRALARALAERDGDDATLPEPAAPDREAPPKFQWNEDDDRGTRLK